MNIQQTEIFREIQLVMSGGIKPVACTWDCEIHVDGRTLKPLYITGLEFDENTMKNYSGVASIEAMFTLAQTDFHIIPNKTKLEVTLRRIPMLEMTSPAIDANGQITTYRYAATLYDATSTLLEGNNPASHSEEAAGRADLKSLKFQLLNPVVERLRMQSVGGVFRKVTGINLARLLLGKYSKTDSADDAVIVKGCNLAPNFSEVKMEHITIPHNTMVVDAPEIIHQNCGGIYGAGFKYYLWKNIWYLFAPFDVKAYEKSTKSLTIINVPANRFPEIERSYRETATQLIMLATGETTHADTSEQDQLNFGNGTRFADARKITEGFLTVEGNVATASKAANVNEIVITHRDNGLNQIKESPRRITTAALLEFGELAAREGSVLQSVWEHSNPNLLYPGMPLKFMYTQNAVAEEVYGVLLGWHTFEIPVTQNPIQRRYISKTILTYFISRRIALSNPK